MASACALAIISGIGFFIRDSEKPAGFSESPFHGRGYPLRLTTFASSPKGEPLGAVGNFTATTKAVPLGKVAATNGSRRKGLALPERIGFPRPGEDVTTGDKRGNLDATNGSRRKGFFSVTLPYKMAKRPPENGNIG